MMPVAPLSGMRVVCLAIYVPGPVAANRLALLGAEVTKIEPATGDPLASWCPPWYAELSAAMRVHRLDLKADGDRAAFSALLDDADLLLTAIRPGALDRLGLGWQSLRERHPGLCHVAIVGHVEPHGEIAGHDLTYQASAGLLSPPHLPRTLLADLAGAERAACAALALLIARERGSGTGRVEVALADAAESFAAPFRHGITSADGVLGGGSPSYALYPTRDGWVALAALEPHFWSRLLSELGLDIDAGREDLETAFRTETATHWAAWASSRGLPLAALPDPR
jgi:crotonobetainyl-CoA:carnitine CoA-transferase CaiB-like acyl-CoA transferase